MTSSQSISESNDEQTKLVREQKRKLRQKLREGVRQALRKDGLSSAKHRGQQHVASVIRSLRIAKKYAARKKIALYISTSSEFLTHEIARCLVRERYQLYAPVVELNEKSERSMSFLPYPFYCPVESHENLNLFQPCPPTDESTGKKISIEDLDVIFLPMVGFSNTGKRLGRGAGYYDRCLAQLFGSSDQSRPLLVGLAYSNQEVPDLPTEPHDIACDVILTDEGIAYNKTESEIDSIPLPEGLPEKISSYLKNMKEPGEFNDSHQQFQSSEFRFDQTSHQKSATASDANIRHAQAQESSAAAPGYTSVGDAPISQKNSNDSGFSGWRLDDNYQTSESKFDLQEV